MPRWMKVYKGSKLESRVRGTEVLTIQIISPMVFILDGPATKLLLCQ